MNADPAQTHIAAQWAHTSPLIACRFDPMGKYVFSTAQDATVQRWNLPDGAKVVLTGHESWPRCIGFSPDGQTVVTGGSEGRLIWWPVAGDAPQPIRKVDGHRGWIRALSVSPDGRLLATGGNDMIVRLWNMADGAPVGELPGHAAHIYSVQFHPDGQFLITGDLKGQVRQWDVSAGTHVRTFDAARLHTYEGGQMVDFGGVRAIAVGQDRKHLACGGLHKASNPLGAVHEPLVMLFDWQAQTLVRSLIAEGITGGVVWRLIHHPQEFLLGVSGGSTGGVLLFWKFDQDKDYHRFALPGLARDMDLHPDKVQVATAHFDNHLRISKMAMKPA